MSWRGPRFGRGADDRPATDPETDIAARPAAGGAERRPRQLGDHIRLGGGQVLEYPTLPDGVVGAGSTHHFAFAVDSSDEQLAWIDYLRGRGVDCTDVFDRGAFRSIYVRDPDGHIVEIATREPGLLPDA